MFCTKCGTNLTDHSMFCPKCGSQVPSAQVLATTKKIQISAIARAWKGEERLWRVFWIYVILGSVVINLVQTILVSIETAGEITRVWNIIIVGVWSFISLLYFIWAMTSLWKCAFNTRWKGLGNLSRAFVILVLISVLGILIAVIFRS